MSAVAQVARAAVFGSAPEAVDAEHGWRWYAVDPDGRVFGSGTSFRDCLEQARECTCHELDQIVRAPVALDRAGIHLQWVEVEVRPAAPRELTFP